MPSSLMDPEESAEPFPEFASPASSCQLVTPNNGFMYPLTKETSVSPEDGVPSGDCGGCGGGVRDQFLLSVAGSLWHADCLRCRLCGLLLDQFPSCYYRNQGTYCKICYHREFGIKCSRCSRVIAATDWVRRARRLVYHLACFACDTCKRQLSTGEEFALQDSRILCKQHYMELIDGESCKVSSKRKTKRVRTTFTEEQLSVLQANFGVDSNPDGQDLERIANITGLSKRVTQVWFQNSRARQKKYQGLGKGGKEGSSGGGSVGGYMGMSDSESEDGGLTMEMDLSPSAADRSFGTGSMSEVLATAVNDQELGFHIHHHPPF